MNDWILYDLIDLYGHGRPVCRARGVKCASPRFCEANVKSLILTIGASTDLDCAPPPVLLIPPPPVFIVTGRPCVWMIVHRGMVDSWQSLRKKGRALVVPAYWVSKTMGYYNSDQYLGKEEMFDRRTNNGRWFHATIDLTIVLTTSRPTH